MRLFVVRCLLCCVGPVTAIDRRPPGASARGLESDGDSGALHQGRARPG